MATYAPLSPPIQGMPIGGQRREVHTMPGYSDEWDLLQEALETTGMFPFAPGLGDFASELGDLILYSSSGKGRTGIDRVNDLDRYAALPATWIGQATQEFGGLLQMTPEQLVQLRRSIGSILSDDNNARSALWEGVKEAGRGYQEDPMSAAEDFGSPGMIGIAAPKLLTGMAKKVLKGEDMPVKQPGVDIQQGTGAFAPETPSKMMPPEVTGQQLQAYHMPETVGWDVDNIPADQWNKFVHTGDPNAIKVEGAIPDADIDKPLTKQQALQEFAKLWGEGAEFKQLKDAMDLLDGPKGSEYAAEMGLDLASAKKRIQQELDRITPSDKSKFGGPVYDSDGMFDLETLEKKLLSIEADDDIDMMSDAKLLKEHAKVNQILEHWPKEGTAGFWSSQEGALINTHGSAGDIKAEFKTLQMKFERESGIRFGGISDDVLDSKINELNKALNIDPEGDLIKPKLEQLVAERQRRRSAKATSETPWAEDNKDLIVGTPTSEDINLFSRTSQSASAGSNQDIQNAIDKVRERLSSASAGDDISDRLITMLNIYIKERAKRLSAGSWDVDFGGNKF